MPALHQRLASSSTTRSLTILVGTFALSTLTLALILHWTLPTSGSGGEDHEPLSLPRSLEQLKELGIRIKGYAEAHPIGSVIAYTAIFTFLQTWSLPGCLYLTIFAGYLFGLPLGLILVCVGSAVGALGCYRVSRAVGGPLLHKYLGDRMNRWKDQLEGERSNMFHYIFILRATPVIPNWFINLSSPHLQVPQAPFFLGTLLGVAPPGFVYVQAGRTLQTLKSVKDLMTWGNVAAMLMIALLALGPVVHRKLRDRRDRKAAAALLYPPTDPLRGTGGRRDLEEGEEEEDEEDEMILGYEGAQGIGAHRLHHHRFKGHGGEGWWARIKGLWGGSKRGGYELLPGGTASGPSIL
ncbi:MAG: snare associated Golgi protein-domain-containing protein [Piptocephalis tieghemiana]|nr:MAG: snare associated Golgi protein-domain-containing protein [Piptocephalis tieghemiana]